MCLKAGHSMIWVHMMDSSVGQQEGVPPFTQPFMIQASPDRSGASKERDEW